MDVSNTRRIVILGKTGSGKSSLANTIFGEKLFKADDSFNSGTSKCKAETKSVNGRSITFIDTPGFFDTDRSEEELKPEIWRCITECAPGPHAFLIVLKVEKFTEQEQDVINKIQQYFSEEVYKYATVVFTHGDQLPEGRTTEDCISKNKPLSDLVKKCGGRCHVIDNKYWNDKPKDEYRSNQFHLEKLLNTIDKTVQANNGRFYTNEILQKVEEKIQQEEERIRLPGNMSKEEIREQAKDSVFKRFLIKLAGIGTGALLGAFFGVAVMVKVVVPVLRLGATVIAAGAVETGTAVVAGAAAAAGGAAAVGILITSAAVGAVVGGVMGYRAAEGAETLWEAAKMSAGAVKDGAQSVKFKTEDVLHRPSQPKFKHSYNQN